MRLSVDGDGKANVIKNVILVPFSDLSGEMNVEIESDGSPRWNKSQSSTCCSLNSTQGIIHSDLFFGSNQKAETLRVLMISATHHMSVLCVVYKIFIKYHPCDSSVDFSPNWGLLYNPKQLKKNTNCLRDFSYGSEKSTPF